MNFYPPLDDSLIATCTVCGNAFETFYGNQEVQCERCKYEVPQAALEEKQNMETPLLKVKAL